MNRTGLFLSGSGGRISPSALRAPVALAADRDAPASLRLRVNLLPTQNQILITRVSENKKGPRKEGLFLFLVAGASCQRYLALVTALDVAS